MYVLDMLAVGGGIGGHKSWQESSKTLSNLVPRTFPFKIVAGRKRPWHRPIM